MAENGQSFEQPRLGSMDSHEPRPMPSTRSFDQKETTGAIRLIDWARKRTSSAPHEPWEPSDRLHLSDPLRYLQHSYPGYDGVESKCG